MSQYLEFIIMWVITVFAIVLTCGGLGMIAVLWEEIKERLSK